MKLQIVISGCSITLTIGIFLCVTLYPFGHYLYEHFLVSQTLPKWVTPSIGEILRNTLSSDNFQITAPVILVTFLSTLSCAMSLPNGITSSHVSRTISGLINYLIIHISVLCHFIFFKCVGLKEHFMTCDVIFFKKFWHYVSALNFNKWFFIWCIHWVI